MAFGVTDRTIDNWKHAHPSFFRSITKAKQHADAKVVRALYERATGYSHPDVHISTNEGDVIITDITKHYPPDTAAAFIWLKNRQGWRDKQEFEHSGEVAFRGTIELVEPKRSDDAD